MKIAISYPPFRQKGVPMLAQNRQFQWFTHPSFLFPLVPASAATLLARDGFEVLWDDANREGLAWASYLARLEEARPALIAFETKTPVVKLHWALVDELRRRLPETRTVLFGDHVRALPAESLERSRADFALATGHADLALLGLARALRDGAPLPPGVWSRGPAGAIVPPASPAPDKVDLDSLPSIDRTLTQASRYFEKWRKRTPFHYVAAGRDCHWSRCTFCAWTALYPEWSVRTPARHLDEIEALVRDHGAREVFDDTGTFPTGDWLDRFCEGMIERGLAREILFSCNMRFGALRPAAYEKMKRAGFRKLKLGLESANEETLRRLEKGIVPRDILDGCEWASHAGLEVHLTVMIGYPWEGRDEIRRTLDMASDLIARGHAEMLQATLVVPYPGTRLHAEALANGWFRIPPDAYERYDMTEPVLATPGLAPEELAASCRRFYQAAFSPRSVARRALSVRSLSDVSYLTRGAAAMIGHIRDFLR